MAYSNNGNVSRDKWGNPQKFIGLYERMSSGGKVYYRGYVQIGTKLYKVDVSQAMKDKVNRKGEPLRYWCAFTSYSTASRQSSNISF